MLESRSATFKMLRYEAHKDRQIKSFVRPYRTDATPYKQLDFSPVVKDACKFRKSATMGLKICKLIIIGDVAVGKTCLVNRFCHEVFDSNYKATIGVDFEVERFDVLNVPFNLQIWDTAGQERFRAIASSYYRGAHAIVVVFDLTSLMTLSHTPSWLKDALEVNPGEPHIYLVGTKRDLMSSCILKEIEGHAIRMALKLGAEFWAVSSYTGNGVKELFSRIACLAFDKAVKQEESKKNEMIAIGSETVILPKTPRRKSAKTFSECHSCNSW